MRNMNNKIFLACVLLSGYVLASDESIETTLTNVELEDEENVKPLETIEDEENAKILETIEDEENVKTLATIEDIIHLTEKIKDGNQNESKSQQVAEALHNDNCESHVLKR